MSTAESKTELTIDELAQRVGMTVRNLREWRTLGLLPPAQMRGRAGYYDASVVARIETVQRLHADGFTLDVIRRMLDAGGAAGDDVMRLAGALRSPFRHEDAGATMATVAAELDDLGIPADDVRETTLAIRGHLDAIADLFEDVWLRHIWQPFLDAGVSAEGLADIGQTAARVQPLAVDAVNALFSAAMEAKIEQSIARQLSRAPAPGG